MTEAIFLHSQVRSWLGQSVLTPFVSSYISYLRSQRHTERTQRGYVYGVAHFAHWLSAQWIGRLASMRKLSEPFSKTSKRLVCTVL